MDAGTARGATTTSTTTTTTTTATTTEAPPRTLWWPAGIYLGLLVVVVTVSWQANAYATPLVPNVWSFPGDSVLGGLARYDGGWYLIISTDGYSGHTAGVQSPVAFFPAYPLTMRLLGAVVGDNAIAGILITIACGTAGSVLFWSWSRVRMATAAATTALLVLLLYPYSYVLYGAIYTEAFFLLAAMLAFRAVEKDQPLLAGTFGAVAACSRPVGLAVAVGLLVAVLERRRALQRPGWFGIPTRIRLTALHGRDCLVLLAFTGFVAYAGFLWVRFGNPFLFASVERYWGHTPGPHTWSKIELYYALRHRYLDWFNWLLLAQGILAVAAIAVVPRIGRSYGWGYAAYTFVVVAIPVMGMKDFDSVGRYLILAFPAFALAGQALARTPATVRRTILALSGLGLLAMTAAFSHGVYLA